MTESTSPELYDKTLQYMPYLTSIHTVVDYVATNAPERAHVHDVMCGTGYFLGLLHARRPDLICRGTDIDADRIGYANARYDGVTFEHGDILEMDHEVPAEVVTCMGALHHIPYDLQGTAILNLASMVKTKGHTVITDCYIDHYEDETERREAAKRLGLAYLEYGIDHGAPRDVQGELLCILRDDMEGVEFKTSFVRRERVLAQPFRDVRTIRTWPEPALSRRYGDYIHICR